MNHWPAAAGFLRANLVVCVMLAIGCATPPVPENPLPPVAPPPEPPPFVAERFAVLSCPERAPVGLRFAGSTLRLDSPSGPLDLLPADAATGMLYAGGGHRLWITGEAALYGVGLAGEEATIECRFDYAADAWDSAQRRGVALRAVGKDWWLEVVPEKWIMLAINQDRARHIAAPAEITTVNDAVRILAQDERHSLEVLAGPLSCGDGAAEVASVQVRAMFDGLVFEGCGRWLPR